MHQLLQSLCLQKGQLNFASKILTLMLGASEVRSHASEVRCHASEVRSHASEVRSHASKVRSHASEVRSHAWRTGSLSTLYTFCLCTFVVKYILNLTPQWIPESKTSMLLPIRQAMHKTAAAAAAESVISFLANVHRCQQQSQVHVPDLCLMRQPYHQVSQHQ